MQPEELINDKQIITQSGHTLVGRPINVHNDELRRLADFMSYRKVMVKGNGRLNPLEQFAIRVLEVHAQDLYDERFWNRVIKKV